MTSRPDKPPALGAADLALLGRLRAIALLLRAAGATCPDLGKVRIGLRLARVGGVSPLLAGGWDVCVLLAEAAGWRDLLVEENVLGRDAMGSHFSRIDAIHDRIVASELPSGVPPGLAHLLASRGPGPIPPAARCFLAQAQWALSPTGIQPLLPARPSAHELLEGWIAAEAAGGLGDGPLGALARSATSTLIEGRRP